MTKKNKEKYYYTLIASKEKIESIEFTPEQEVKLYAFSFEKGRDYKDSYEESSALQDCAKNSILLLRDAIKGKKNKMSHKEYLKIEENSNKKNKI